MAPGLRVLHGRARFVSSAFSPDGSRVVSANLDGTARIWDVRDGQTLHVLLGHGGAVYSAVFSPDGARIVTASEDETARIWDADNGKNLHVLRGHNGAVDDADFSPDGTRIVTAGEDGTARIWDVGSGQSLQVLRGHNGAIYSAALARTVDSWSPPALTGPRASGTLEPGAACARFMPSGVPWTRT